MLTILMTNKYKNNEISTISLKNVSNVEYLTKKPNTQGPMPTTAGITLKHMCNYRLATGGRCLANQGVGGSNANTGFLPGTGCLKLTGEAGNTHENVVKLAPDLEEMLRRVPPKTAVDLSCLDPAFCHCAKKAA
jgi:hypothetical protein